MARTRKKKDYSRSLETRDRVIANCSAPRPQTFKADPPTLTTGPLLAPMPSDAGYHMPKAQLSNQHKPRNPEPLTPQQNKFSPHISKKKKRSHPSQLLPAFCDNLFKIDLTKRALEELDRISEPPPHDCIDPLLDALPLN